MSPPDPISVLVMLIVSPLLGVPWKAALGARGAAAPSWRGRAAGWGHRLGVFAVVSRLPGLGWELPDEMPAVTASPLFQRGPRLSPVISAVPSFRRRMPWRLTDRPTPVSGPDCVLQVLQGTAPGQEHPLPAHVLSSFPGGAERGWLMPRSATHVWGWLGRNLQV